MVMDYIVVQAGGKGTRLEYLTENKPKALVPVENFPMLFHLFRLFPDKKFIIIGDYQIEVLREYLSVFAAVSYLLVEAEGTGTCAGLEKALEFVPEQEAFLLIWSDLILPETFFIPPVMGTYIGISQSFSCPWSYVEGQFQESPSVEQGVAGLFVFPDKSFLKGVPESGELVPWIARQGYEFEELGLSGTREFCLLAQYETLELLQCRPFNRIWIEDGIFYKKPLDEKGEALAVGERQWYTHAIEQGFSAIPTIHSFSPLSMDAVEGGAMHENQTLTLAEKQKLLAQTIRSLQELHGLAQVPVDAFSLKEAYFTQPMASLGKVRDLIPMAGEKEILINGKLCPNVFFSKRALESALEKLDCKEFVLLHGDCTFSNIMLQPLDALHLRPVFIDPQASFGHTELYGDANYDWAKLYASIVGNYDTFHQKQFSLHFQQEAVSVTVSTNGWESLEEYFFRLTGANPQEVKLLHAVIWLSFATYSWEDYDSICAAFYLGLWYLQEALEEN